MVGFKTSISSAEEDNEAGINRDNGYCLWAKEFVRNLSEGKTVQQASSKALSVLKAKNPTLSHCYGMDSVYIAGDTDQVVKH